LYIVSGHNLDEAALLRAIELSALKYCPAQAMLSKAFPMELAYEIYETKGGGEKELVKQGQWMPRSNVKQTSEVFETSEVCLKCVIQKQPFR
jgi:hypothetical protein